jgi:hypothetical protein
MTLWPQIYLPGGPSILRSRLQPTLTTLVKSQDGEAKEKSWLKAVAVEVQGDEHKRTTEDRITIDDVKTGG